MNQIIEKIDKRIWDLQQIIQTKENALKSAPEGLINITQSGKRVEYYHKFHSTDTVKKYIKSSQKQLVSDLCQKDYDEKVLVAAKSEWNMLQRLRKHYQKGIFEDIYESLSDCRKKLVIPIRLSDSEFVSNWENVNYVKKEFREDAPEYYTDRGERVRSKSEILIANALYKHKIPYRYEYPLALRGVGTIHPDFTVLNIRLRKEYLWEHLGMMGDAEYSEKAIQRIHTYEKNGLFPGEKVILSYETLKHPLSTQHIEKIIMHYLK